MIYAYLRVSDQSQVDSGLGLEAQRATIDAYAFRAGQSVARYFTDAGICGAEGLDKREALAEALALLRKGDTLIVAKRDRLARDALLSGWLDKEAKKGGWRIVSAAGEGTENDDPTSILMRRIVDAFAEYERLVIGFRTKLALKAKRARGERTGGRIPFGYTSPDGVRLEPCDSEQRTLARILELRAAGLSYRAISEALEAEDHRPRTGLRFDSAFIGGLIRRHGPVVAA